MNAQRIFGRFSQRASQQMRSAPVRSTVQRRANSTEAKPSWIVDNEFNRERAAVKHHAASTSGQSYPIYTIDTLGQLFVK
jgi:cytochrome c oxidase subunit 6a